jgi:hypothetical protein
MFVKHVCDNNNSDMYVICMYMKYCLFTIIFELIHPRSGRTRVPKCSAHDQALMMI